MCVRARARVVCIRCWAEGVVPAEDDYAKGALRTAIKEKDWGKFGGGMSLIGIASWRDY